MLLHPKTLYEFVADESFLFLMIVYKSVNRIYTIYKYLDLHRSGLAFKIYMSKFIMSETFNITIFQRSQLDKTHCNFYKHVSTAAVVGSHLAHHSGRTPARRNQ